MKKFFLILLAMAQISLFSCSKTDKSDPNQSSQSAKVSSTETNSESQSSELTFSSDNDLSDPSDKTKFSSADPDADTQSSGSELSSAEYIKVISHTDEKIQSVVSDEKYQKADLNDRKLLIESILEQLLNEGSIVNFDFELEAELPYATYEFEGGGKGVVMLKEFPKDQN